MFFLLVAILLFFDEKEQDLFECHEGQLKEEGIEYGQYECHDSESDRKVDKSLEVAVDQGALAEEVVDHDWRVDQIAAVADAI